jgi:hypothetical protein
MNKATAALIAASLTSLVACTSGSIEALKKEAAVGDSFTLHQNYQAATRQLSRRIHECMGVGSASIFSSPVELKTQIYSDLKEAELTYFHPASNSHFFHIELDGKEATDKTKVTSWIYHQSQKDLTGKFRAWASNPASPC